MSYSAREYQKDNVRNHERIALVLETFPDAMFEHLWGDVRVFTADGVVPTDVLAVTISSDSRLLVPATALIFPYQKLCRGDLEANVFLRGPMRSHLDIRTAIEALKAKAPLAYAALVAVCR